MIPLLCVGGRRKEIYDSREASRSSSEGAAAKIHDETPMRAIQGPVRSDVRTALSEIAHSFLEAPWNSTRSAAAKLAEQFDYFAPNPSALLARELTSKGGSGTDSDIALIAAELQKLPAPILQMASEAGIRVTVCRDSVADALPHLKGMCPKGWPPGLTWDHVPGACPYTSDDANVVIATVTEAPDKHHGRARASSILDLDLQGRLPGISLAAGNFRSYIDIAEADGLVSRPGRPRNHPVDLDVRVPEWYYQREA